MQIATLLLAGLSLNNISETTELSKKRLDAHIKNMMRKLKAKNVEELIKYLRVLKPEKKLQASTASWVDSNQYKNFKSS